MTSALPQPVLPAHVRAARHAGVLPPFTGKDAQRPGVDHVYSTFNQTGPSFSQEEGNQDKAASPPSPLLAVWRRFLLTAPVIGLTGGVLMVTHSLPKSLRTKIIPPQLDTGVQNLGRKLLGGSVLLRSIGGISAGIVSGQPNMILGNLVQTGAAGILAFSKSKAVQNLATSLEMLLGGLYTVGFANELKNKDPNTPASEIRKYDMSHLKSLFRPGNPLTWTQRAKGTAQELGHMTAFAATDHVLLVKNVVNALRQAGTAQTSQVTPREKAEQWVKAPSALKSQIAALFFYMGSLPIVFLTRRNPKIGEKKVIVALKGLGMIIANAAPFAIALNRDDFRGKAPLVGVPMAVLGMANSKNPFYVGLGHLGESFNDVFFSDVAVNGVNTGRENKPAE